LASRDVYLNLAMRAGNYRPPEAWYPHTRFTRALWLNFFDLKNREKVRLANLVSFSPLLGNPGIDPARAQRSIEQLMDAYRACFPYIDFGQQPVQHDKVDDDIAAYKQMFPELD
jgi:hypothetical protein